jgi:predicted TIM-barrel fold metal-dependent hydrolase
MMALATQHQNVWIDCHGQSLTDLDSLIESTGGERLLFGSDWPFYHLGMSLAKVLIATQSVNRDRARRLILKDNASHLMQI